MFDDGQKYVVDSDKAADEGDQIGAVLFYLGVYAVMLATEFAQTAQEFHNMT
ncbi:MAG: hypothetical protein OXC62_08785 [Aestuariivita sp.]|nr:hypothetical protein [Aestuariivita sp.]